MSTFTLAVSCLTTFSLPWFMDLTFQVPVQYCSLQHQTLLLSPVTSTTRCCFCFGVIFILSGVISPLISYWRCILGTYLPGEFLFQYPIILPFHVVHGILKARILKWFAILFSCWTTFCQTPPPWSNRLGWPHMVWLSFIELDTTVSMWSDWRVFCDYGFSVSALWCPLTTPTILLGFLLPRTLGISSWLLQQSIATAPYLGRGVSPHDCPSWPWTWSSSFWPPPSRPFKYDLNQIPYDYTVEVWNGFKGLDLIDKSAWWTMDRGSRHCTGGSD